MSNDRDMKQVVASLLGVGGLVAIIIGLVQFASAGKNKQLAGRVKPQAQTITADDLGRSGPGDNLYVKVTNLEFGDDTLTIRSGKGSRWQQVFMPVYPKGRASEGRAPLILVSSTSISNAEELRSFATRSSVVGIVTNPLEEPPAHVEKFKEKYSKFEGKDIWLVDVSREVPTAAKVESNYFVGALLLCAAVGLFGGSGWMAYQISQAPRPRPPALPPAEDELRDALRVPGQPGEESTASELASRFDPRRR